MAEKDNDQLEPHEIGIGLLVSVLGIGFILFSLDMCQFSREPEIIVVEKVIEVEKKVPEESIKKEAVTKAENAPKVAADKEAAAPQKSAIDRDQSVKATAAPVEVETHVESATASLNAFGQKLGGLFSLSLPNGVTLDVPEGGLEDKLVTNLNAVADAVADSGADTSSNSADSNSSEQQLTAHIFDRIYFKTNSYALDETSNSQVENTAQIIKAYDIQAILIRGHTDSTGSPETNFQLSINRARAVRKALVNAGVTAKINIKGLGETEPVDTNDTEEGRRNNRRIDITVLQ